MRACARARVRVCGASAPVRVCVRARAGWECACLRAGPLGALGNRLQDKCCPAAPRRAHSLEPTRAPRRGARALSRRTPPPRGPGNPLPRVPGDPVPRPLGVVINLTFSAGWKGRIGAARGGSFLPREVLFPTGICGEAGRREADGDADARRRAPGSASRPESGCARGPTHSGFAINYAVQIQKTAGIDQDTNQDAGILGNRLRRKFRSGMKLNYCYFENALQCKFKIRVCTWFYSPGYVPHTPKPGERGRVLKVVSSKVLPITSII